MTTDNRTNETTPEQVDAAAKAIADCHNPGMFERYPENWRVEARAALVAAHGAAPQAGRRPKRLLNQLNRIADALEEHEFEGVAADAPAWMRNAAEYIESERQWRAPVLPSSGVDEDALAERAARSVRSAVEVVVREVMPDAAIAARVAEELEEVGLLASSLNQAKIEAYIKKLNGKGQHAKKY